MVAADVDSHNLEWQIVLNNFEEISQLVVYASRVLRLGKEIRNISHNPILLKSISHLFFHCLLARNSKHILELLLI